MERGSKLFGGVVEKLEFKPVNRLMYMCVRPVGAPPEAKSLPPKWLFKLIQLLHPKIRAWRNRANKAYKNKS